jgi:uncharacterized protein
MKMGMRVCVLLGLFACVAPAVEWKALKPQGYVSDFAQVVDPAAKAQLENFCAIVEQSTGAQIALVTIPSLENEPVENVANSLFRSWGVGQKGKNEGILLLLSINDRRNRLEIGYGLEPILPDGLSGSTLREMRPALRQQAYGEALMAAAETIGATIAKAKNVTLTATLPRTIRPTPDDSLPSAVIAGGIILLFLLFRIVAYALRTGGHGGPGGGGGAGGLLAAMFLGNMMSGSFGGNSSGGFGGSDSSDGGFGGFGGGDSGGGGASSDW